MACEGVATDCMQMKVVTTCERFITLLQEGFALFLYCVTSWTKECRRPVTRESGFGFAGGHFCRGYNLFGTELFQPSPLVFTSGHNVAAGAIIIINYSSYFFYFFIIHGLPFLYSQLILIIDILIGPIARAVPAQDNIHTYIHTYIHAIIWIRVDDHTAREIENLTFFRSFCPHDYELWI